MSKSTAEIRQAFLDFFHSKGHQVVASSSLVPHNDPNFVVYQRRDEPVQGCVPWARQA